jgi:hypothetical protein
MHRCAGNAGWSLGKAAGRGVGRTAVRWQHAGQGRGPRGDGEHDRCHRGEDQAGESPSGVHPLMIGGSASGTAVVLTPAAALSRAAVLNSSTPVRPVARFRICVLIVVKSPLVRSAVIAVAKSWIRARPGGIRARHGSGDSVLTSVLGTDAPFIRRPGVCARIGGALSGYQSHIRQIRSPSNICIFQNGLPSDMLTVVRRRTTVAVI